MILFYLTSIFGYSYNFRSCIALIHVINNNNIKIEIEQKIAKLTDCLFIIYHMNKIVIILKIVRDFFLACSICFLLVNSYYLLCSTIEYVFLFRFLESFIYYQLKHNHIVYNIQEEKQRTQIFTNLHKQKQKQEEEEEKKYNTPISHVIESTIKKYPKKHLDISNITGISTPPSEITRTPSNLKNLIITPIVNESKSIIQPKYSGTSPINLEDLNMNAIMSEELVLDKSDNILISDNDDDKDNEYEEEEEDEEDYEDNVSD